MTGSQPGGAHAGRRGELGALVAEAEPGLSAHLHVADREDALAPGARDAPLIPVLVHLSDQADALPLGEKGVRIWRASWAPRTQGCLHGHPGDGAPRGWEVESQEPNPGCLATQQKSQGSLVANNTGPDRALASFKLHGPGQLTLPL